MDLHYKLYFLLLLLTLAAYVYVYPRQKLYAGKMIALMILWLFTAASAIYLSLYLHVKNNLFIFHISTPVEYAIVALLYRDAIVNKGVRRFVFLSIPFFFLLSILFALFIQRPDVNNSTIILVQSAILIFLPLFFLREVLLLQQVPVLHRYPMFWISVAILIYYTGTLVVEGTMNYLVKQSMQLARRLYRMSYFVKYLSFILFIIGAACSLPFTFKKNKR